MLKYLVIFFFILSFANSSANNKNKIIENLKIVKNKINKKSKNIFLLNQVHSNKLVFINKNLKFNKKKLKADAIVTDLKKNSYSSFNCRLCSNFII